MKQDVFNQYVDKIVDVFRIKKSELFTKSKKRDFVDARYLLYYLCSKRPMNVSYIEKYMKDNGYEINHNTIIHGIAVVEDRMNEDADYVSIISKIENSVFI